MLVCMCLFSKQHTVMHCTCTFSVARNTLGLQLSPQIGMLPFHKVAALLYRDNVDQKHGERGRLLEEIEDKKKGETAKRKAMLKDRQDQRQPLDDCAQMMVSHLLSVA